MLGLRECKTAAEVFANYKAVRARVKQWRPPVKKIEIKAAEPEAVKIEIVRPAPVEELTIEEPNIPPQPTVHDIIKTVCQRYGVTRMDFLSHRRTASIVRPRQVGYYLAKNLTLLSLPAIGRLFNGRDHTTILSGIRKITRIRPVDPELDAVLTELESALRPQP